MAATSVRCNWRLPNLETNNHSGTAAHAKKEISGDRLIVCMFWELHMRCQIWAGSKSIKLGNLRQHRTGRKRHVVPVNGTIRRLNSGYVLEAATFRDVFSLVFLKRVGNAADDLRAAFDTRRLDKEALFNLDNPPLEREKLWS
jgi:hypothetical protein